VLAELDPQSRYRFLVAGKPDLSVLKKNNVNQLACKAVEIRSRATHIHRMAHLKGDETFDNIIFEGGNVLPTFRAASQVPSKKVTQVTV